MMDTEKYSRSVSLNCPTCGGDQFEHEGDTAQIFECTNCKRSFEKAELIDANRENVAAHIEEIGDELRADLLKSLKKSFSGSKFIKFT